MTTLMGNAWLGWRNYMEAGKLTALLLAALLFLLSGIGRKGKRTENMPLLLYTAVMTACCVIPVSAAVLMLYQTRFYDYEWIWSLVPATAVTAYGAAVFLEECGSRLPGSSLPKSRRKKAVGAAALLVAVLLLCGGAGRETWDHGQQAIERERAEAVLKELRDRSAGTELCLWAPRDIVEYARELDGGIRLIYGRNMWDISLNAYAYDTYDDSVYALYRFMERDTETAQTDAGGEQPVTAAQCADILLRRGVNCILLPQTMEAETRMQLESALGTAAERLGDYYLLSLSGGEDSL